jgi:hypothetical protein
MRQSLLALALSVVPGIALAHHGQDFMLVESPAVPHPGSAYFVVNTEAVLGSSAEDPAAFVPALLVGISPRIAFELHAHSEKLRGEDWRYEALAPAVHLLLTDPENHHGFKLGVSGEYEIAREHGAPDTLEVRLSLENGFARSKWTANLIAAREQGLDTTYAAALGFRTQLRPGLALGLETVQNLDRAEGSELLAGAYLGKTDDRSLKLGLGARKLDDGRTSAVAQVSLLFKIR